MIGAGATYGAGDIDGAMYGGCAIGAEYTFGAIGAE
jgi:hypothetical protein